MQRNDPRYGRGEHVIAEAAAALADPGGALAAEIRARFAAPDYKPPLLPKVALDVHALTQDAEVDFGRLARLLEEDGLLAARILRIAQSPLYGPRSAMPTLRAALTRLGLRTLSEIVWEAALRERVFRCPGFDEPMETLRRHSTATAYVARLVASYTPLAAEYAFVCGLVHDIGMAAAMIALGERRDAKALPLELLAAALRQGHEEHSGLIATLWNLPGDLPLVLGHHHLLRVGGYVHPMAAVVYLAETLCADRFPAPALGASQEPCEVHTDELRVEATRALQLTPPQVASIEHDATKVLDGLG